jgi:hypothetical protein
MAWDGGRKDPITDLRNELKATQYRPVGSDLRPMTFTVVIARRHDEAIHDFLPFWAPNDALRAVINSIATSVVPPSSQ